MGLSWTTWNMKMMVSGLEPVEQIITATGSIQPGMIRLYPNPAKNLITIEGIGYEHRDVEIYDLTGQLRGKYVMNERGRCSLDVSVYRAGMLLIKVGNEIHKVVVVD